MNQDTLQAYSLACGFFAQILQKEPDAALLGAIHEKELLEEWPLPVSTEQGRAGLQQMQRFAKKYDDQSLEQVQREYTELFIGPADPLPQWESMCTTEDRLLFGEATLAVREAYAEFGISSPNNAHEPDDHIGYELAFVGNLLQRAAQLLKAGQDTQQTGQLLVGTQDFLETHLLVWCDEFFAALLNRAQTDLYCGAARLCPDMLQSLHQELSRVIK